MGICTAARRLGPLSAALLLALGGCAQVSSSSAAPAGSSVASSSSAEPPARSGSAAGSTVSAPPVEAVATARSTAATPAAATPPASSAPPLVTAGAGEVVSPLPSCPGRLRTAVPGTLSVTATSTARPPWFVGSPSGGAGFEAAVVAAVARQLGFPADRVAWKTADPARIQAGALQGSDVAVGEFRTPDQAGGPVDYSTGYFSISNSVVARVGTPAARATGLAGLKDVRVAALPAGTAPAAGDRINSSRTSSYQTSAAALSALRAGSVDAVVVPTPVAVTAGPGLAVVGQLPTSTEQPVQFGMILAKHSPLTACVSAAIDQLRITGALAELVATWVPAANRPLK